MLTLVCDNREASVISLKPVTREMIKIWKMNNVDWMGYKVHRKSSFTFHHLIVPNRLGGPYEMWNGAILCGSTAHPYLHVIENIDYDRFLYITSLLIYINGYKRLDYNTISNIDACLKVFESEYQGKCYKSKKRIIKPEYTIRDYTGLK